MRLQTIPDDQQLLADRGLQGFEELDDLRTLDRAIEQAEVEPPVAQAGNHRQLFPAEAVLKDRSLARRQCAFFEKPHQLLALCRAESLRTPKMRRPTQCLHAALLSCMIPTHCGLARHADLSRDLGLAFPSREQPRAAPPTSLQLFQFL